MNSSFEEMSVAHLIGRWKESSQYLCISDKRSISCCYCGCLDAASHSPVDPSDPNESDY